MAGHQHRLAHAPLGIDDDLGGEPFGAEIGRQLHRRSRELAGCDDLRVVVQPQRVTVGLGRA